MGIVIPPMRPIIVKGGVALSNNHTLLENAIGILLLIILCSIPHTILWYYLEIIEEKKEDRPKLIIKSVIHNFFLYTSVFIFFGLCYLIMNKFL